MARIVRDNVFKRVDYYDSFLASEYDHQYLFGNANIGWSHLTNLQVGGALAFDERAFIEHWYARTDMQRTDESARAFWRWAHYSTIELVVGDKLMWQASLHTLLRDRPWCPKERLEQFMTEAELAELAARRAESEMAAPLVIPVRQNVAVRIQSEATVAALARQALASELPRVWIHLEGYRGRDIA